MDQQITSTVTTTPTRARVWKHKHPMRLNLVNRSLNSQRIQSSLHHPKLTLNLLSRQILSNNLQPFKKTHTRILTALFQRPNLNQGLRRQRRQQPKISKRRRTSSRIRKNNKNSTSKRNKQSNNSSPLLAGETSIMSLQKKQSPKRMVLTISRKTTRPKSNLWALSLLTTMKMSICSFRVILKENIKKDKTWAIWIINSTKSRLNRLPQDRTRN